MQRKKDSTRQRNAGSQIVLDSIFAALAGIWITFALPDQVSASIRAFEVSCSLISFFCFAISAEGTTTAFDEWDVLKYVYYLLVQRRRRPSRRGNRRPDSHAFRDAACELLCLPTALSLSTGDHNSCRLGVCRNVLRASLALDSRRILDFVGRYLEIQRLPERTE
jgi:hypothetical protein